MVGPVATVGGMAHETALEDVGTGDPDLAGCLRGHPGRCRGGCTAVGGQAQSSDEQERQQGKGESAMEHAGSMLSIREPSVKA